MKFDETKKNNNLDIKGIENFIKIENLNVENDSNKKRNLYYQFKNVINDDKIKKEALTPLKDEFVRLISEKNIF